MRNLIKKILKESDDFGLTPEFEENPAKDFLYNLMQDLQMLESKKEPGWVVYKDKDGKILMVSNPSRFSRPTLFVDYNKIWKKLRSMGLDNKEIEQLCIKGLGDIFNRWSVVQVIPSRVLRIPFLLTHILPSTDIADWPIRHG